MTGSARWKVISYALALFIAGAISGAMVTYRKVEIQHLALGRQKEIAEHIRQKLKTALDLTPEQENKMGPAIEKTAEELETSHRNCLNQISAAVDKLHLEIASELNADQKEKLKQLEAQQREARREKYNYSPEPTNLNSGAH